MTHDHCVEKYDAGSLYCIASKVVNQSIEIADLIRVTSSTSHTLVYTVYAHHILIECK